MPMRPWARVAGIEARRGDLDDSLAKSGQVPCQSGSVRASTFDSEGNDLAQPGRPAMETLVTPRCSGQPALTQPGAKAINCHGYMFVSVCVDSDNDPGKT